MSYGYTMYLNVTDTPNPVQFSRGTDSGYVLDGGALRGVTHTDTTRVNSNGIMGEYQGLFNGKAVYGYPRKYTSVDADIQSLINAGIIVCIAAGNDYMKADVEGGVDFGNYYNITNGTFNYRWYYHIPGSPSIYYGSNSITTATSQTQTKNPGFNVGAIGSNNFSGVEYKASFSQSGPAVNIWAAGQNIQSTCSTTNSIGGITYHGDSNFRQAKISGTSMASPQMAGMAACLLQAHPDWTPTQVMEYFEKNSKTLMYETANNDNDYAINSSIHGSANRFAFFPMHGQRPFNISEV